MAVEPKRGCGYRKVGGLYLVSGNLSAPCDRLPWPLEVCPTCGGGIKFSRGFTWIQPFPLFGTHAPKAECRCFQERATINPFQTFDENTGIEDIIDYEYANCPMCSPLEFFGEEGTAGLLWIGEQHYKTPGDFTREGAELGVSRRIKAVPRGFKVGETWIFVAHIKAVHPLARPVSKEITFDDIVSGSQKNLFDDPEAGKPGPGIFAAFKPHRIERIVKQSEYDVWKPIEDERVEFNETEEWKDWIENRLPKDKLEIYKRLQADVERGITLVPVPDDDPDHQ